MLKRIIQRSLGVLGYQISRATPQVGKPIDVLDLLVQTRFASRGEDVTIVQIGANDGSSNDPVSGYIDKYHWRGLLVEPQPKIHALLVERYRNEPQLMFENAAVGAIDETMEFFCFRDDPIVPAYASQLASLRKDVLMRHVERWGGRKDLVTSVRVPVLTFASLLARHGVGRFDMLFIDTEGYDFEILKTVDFQTHRPSIVYYEHRHVSTVDRGRARARLADAGYLMCELDGDTIACLDGKD